MTAKEKVHILKISEVMTKQPITVADTATIEQCAKVMAQHKIGSLIIEEEQIRGIITDTDIVRRVVAKNLDPKKTLVKEVMSKDIITISPDDTLLDAVKLMAKHSIRHLIVMGKEDLEGYVTAKDILKAEPALFKEMIQHINLKGKERNTKA